jgi:hypothetical protein
MNTSIVARIKIPKKMLNNLRFKISPLNKKARERLFKSRF